MCCGNVAETFLVCTTTCILIEMELALCLLGNVSCFFCLLIFFSKSTFWKISLKNINMVSNSLDSGQARHFVGPDLGPNCFQR